MSSKNSSRINKRGAGREEHDEPNVGRETKRQRRIEDNDRQPASDAVAAHEQRLEREEKDLLARIESKEQELAQMKRRLERVKDQLVSVKEKKTKAELQKRLSGNQNPRIEEAMAMIKSGSVPLDDIMEHQFPDLIDSVDFWFAFLASKDDIPLSIKVYEIMHRFIPPSVLNNKELMLQFCLYDPRIYSAISDDGQLKNDEQLLGIVLASDPFLVTSVPASAQRQNSRLIGETVAKIPQWDEILSHFAKTSLVSAMWDNRDVVLGWVKGGGDLHDEIPLRMREDPEVLLAFMGSRIPTFENRPTIPPNLCGNKEFMKQAVEKNVFVLNLVGGNLKGDRDLALAALSGTNCYNAFGSSGNFVPEEVEAGENRTLRFWLQIAEWVRQELRGHDTFVKLILGSVRFSNKKPSILAMLDQGKETSSVSLKLIAAFAGVPVGKHLGKLRQARKSLAKGGISWSD